MTVYVVQSVQASGTTVSTLSGTMAPVRPGNALVLVAMSSSGSGNNGTVSSVTLNGAADNFTFYQQSGNQTSTGVIQWWADPSCAGSSPGTAPGTVAVTWGGITGTPYYTQFSVLEVGGLMPYTANLMETSGTQQATATAWNSGTITCRQVPDLIVGAVLSAATPSTPAFPWINLPKNTGVARSQVSYQVSASTPLMPVLNGTFSGSNAYNAGIVALQGMPGVAPAYPTFTAGSGPQQGDLNTLVSAPLSFTQQRVVFRSQQSSTTTLLPSGQPGASVRVTPDLILEDPYQGYNPGAGGTTPSWLAPFTGWYMVQHTVSVGTCATDTILNFGSFGSLIMPAGGIGVASYFDYIFAVGGVNTITTFGAKIFGATSCHTSNTPPSTCEIYWLGYSAF